MSFEISFLKDGCHRVVSEYNGPIEGISDELKRLGRKPNEPVSVKGVPGPVPRREPVEVWEVHSDNRERKEGRMDASGRSGDKQVGNQVEEAHRVPGLRRALLVLPLVVPIIALALIPYAITLVAGKLSGALLGKEFMDGQEAIKDARLHR